MTDQMEMNLPIKPETISVLGKDVTRIEYQGRRVVTLNQIDMLHERPEGTARRQFNSIKPRIQQDRDFIKMSANEFRTRFPGIISDRATEGLTLVTEYGYGKILKGWNDDLSWQLHDAMQESYFFLKHAMTEDDVALRVEKLSDSVDRHGKKIPNTTVGGVAHYIKHHVLAPLMDYLDVRLKAVYDRDVKMIHQQQKIADQQVTVMSRMETLMSRADPLAYNPKNYCDIDGVYKLANVINKIPRRGVLSNNVSKSLTAYFIANRSPQGGFVFDMQQIPVQGRHINLWHNDLVEAWLNDRGAAMIVAHIKQCATASPVNVVPITK